MRLHAHSIAPRLIVLAAYLLHVAAAAGGAVVCQSAHGGPSIELSCDHDHCPTPMPADHDHDAHDDQGSRDCLCAACPCDDAPLTVTLAVPHRQDHAESVPIAAALASRTVEHTMAWHEQSRGALARPPPARFAPSIALLRSIVLIL